MKIIWDEPKRRANLLKHGLDFADLTLEFFEDAYFEDTKLGRRLAVGWLNGRGTTVVHVQYGLEAISVISMRPASEKEREAL
ncbi:BrnT family toxin [Devosia rhizoryzae]|uniref:BrnT family toxin n=1 Tax=Devosia rhizoryzae TaxID=2774137 RepID=A0ABX7CAS5_9HYPH|nr:BrnT family toxin [Devosia rhizoryzae]QQR40888.1 BrnT family toxin [Devosia rhizoryzae]